MTGKDGFPLVAPSILLSEDLVPYWLYFWEVSDSLCRIQDDVAVSIPPSEWLAWSTMMQTKLSPDEYKLLRMLDKAFCEQMNQELSERRQRLSDKGK